MQHRNVTTARTSSETAENDSAGDQEIGRDVLDQLLHLTLSTALWRDSVLSLLSPAPRLLLI